VCPLLAVIGITRAARVCDGQDLAIAHERPRDATLLFLKRTCSDYWTAAIAGRV
jgi:hypothetical protein